MHIAFIVLLFAVSALAVPPWMRSRTATVTATGIPYRHDLLMETFSDASGYDNGIGYWTERTAPLVWITSPASKPLYAGDRGISFAYKADTNAIWRAFPTTATGCAAGMWVYVTACPNSGTGEYFFRVASAGTAANSMLRVGLYSEGVGHPKIRILGAAGAYVGSDIALPGFVFVSILATRNGACYCRVYNSSGVLQATGSVTGADVAGGFIFIGNGNTADNAQSGSVASLFLSADNSKYVEDP